MRVNKLLKGSHLALLYFACFAFALAVLVPFQQTMDARYWRLGVDGYLRRVAAEAVWQGRNPYTEQVTEEIERVIVGHVQSADDIRLNFYDPAYAAVILLPLLLLPLDWLGVIWSAFVWAMLLAVALAWSIALRVKPFVIAALALSVILFRPALLNMFSGQYALFIIGCGGLALYLYERQHLYAAGCLLALCTIKPSLTLLAPFVVLLWALRWRQWKMIVGFGLTLSIVTALSFERIGWWIPDFLQRVSAYAPATRSAGLPWAIQDVFTLPGLAWLGVTLPALGIGVYQLAKSPSIPWLAILGAIHLNLMLTPHGFDYDLTILLISLFWLGAEGAHARGGLGVWLVLAWLPWLSWFAVVQLDWGIEGYWIVIWRFYPVLLLTLSLAWAERDWLAARVSRQSVRVGDLSAS